MTRQIPSDLAEFIARLRAGEASTPRERSEPLVGRQADTSAEGALYVARAPGRLDVMGGIADYSGALVLQWPIRESTRVALRRHADRVLNITSAGADRVRRVDVPLDLFDQGRASYENVRAWFDADPERHWAAYVAGVFHVLAREAALALDGGAAVLVESDVPEGKGVSSSAAIEAATMEAVLAAWSLTLDPRMRAIRCQQVENLVVGAPCGVMDQMASICGEEGRLMALLCQPAEFRGTLALPQDLAVWGIDSGIRHAVTGADYGAVRIGAFMGYRVIAELAGLAVTPGDSPRHVRIEDPRWHGYLANMTPDVFAEFESRIPVTATGESFLARYHGTTDPVTDVDPAKTYAVRTPSAHPVHEHWRVEEWARLLAAPDADSAGVLGELMYQSHASYSACGLGSDGTDLLVQLAREAGASEGIFGAKITGGGSGGTVAILARRGAGARVARIARDYEGRTGRATYLFEGSSPGAAAVGVVRIDPSAPDA
jgi:galactokinase